MVDAVYIEEQTAFIMSTSSIEMTSVRMIEDDQEWKKDIADEYVFVSIYMVGLLFLLVFVCWIHSRRRTRMSRGRTSASLEDKPPTYQNLFFSDPLPEYESLTNSKDADCGI